MKKVIGYLCLAPVAILMISISLSPIYIGFKETWAPAIIVYGSAIVVGLGAFGLSILEKE